MEMKHTTPAHEIREDHDALMDACGKPTYDQLEQVNAELLAALKECTERLVSAGYQTVAYRALIAKLIEA